jgi:peptide methionine sulfoxide reductase MsrB
MPLSELITFKVTEEMKKKMKKYSNINWSAELRAHIARIIAEQEKIEQESPVNYCGNCGARLFASDDKFCSKCGALVVRPGP